MGCTNTREDKVITPSTKTATEGTAEPIPQQPELPHVDTLEGLRIGGDAFVHEKTTKITELYDFFEPPIGKGAFGAVKKAKFKQTGDLRAVKIISKKTAGPKDIERMIYEVNLMKGLDHPSIIKVLEYYQDRDNFYIVTELCSGGELFEMILKTKQHAISESKAANLMKQLLSAVTYCHDNKIVHRDLKPENLLMVTKSIDSALKVIDFGVSRNFDPENKLKHKMGTIYYMAPEVLAKSYDEKCDVWSCGVIMYLMLCGAPPFKGETDDETKALIKAGKVKFKDQIWSRISKEGKALIEKLLNVDPKERISAKAALDDVWFEAKATHTEITDVEHHEEALSGLKGFHAEQKLAQATYIFMVNYMSAKDEREELQKLFRTLDTNGDGTLTRDELVDGYHKVFKAVNAEEIVDAIMKEVDTNKSEKIDYSEFVTAAMNRQTLLSMESLEAAFKAFDTDKSGFITPAELKAMLSSTQKVDDNVWNELINEVDKNSDKKISLAEFKEMMLKSVAPAPKKESE